MDTMHFPDGFLWGTASSGYMTEGGITNNDFHMAYLEDLKNPPGKRVFADDCGNACEFWTRYETDYDLAKEMGITIHRMSIEWSRIFPEEDTVDESAVLHYKKIITALRTRGIKVMLTLHHLAIPFWLVKYGSFLNRKVMVSHFRKYVEVIADRLGDLVDVWAPVEEPSAIPIASYYVGVLPPYTKNLLHYIKAYRTMIDMHVTAYKIIKDKFPGSSIGVPFQWFYFQPYDENSLWDKLGCAYSDWSANKVFFNAMKTGRIKPPIGLWEKFDDLKNSMDYVALNYYTRFYCRGFGIVDSKPGEIVTDRDWSVYPEGLYDVLHYLNDRFRLPIIITENGLATTDESFRIRFIEEHLSQVLRAIKDGVPVTGYMHWCLTDNWEWVWGYEKRLGLIHIDYATQKRTIKESGRRYSEIIRNNSL